MKKVLCFAFTAAFVFGAALSCSKEEQAIDNNENQKPEVADPAVDPETTWTFTALAESPVSKMGGMDASGEFAWENGDEIKIIWDGGSTTAAATVAAGRTSFEPAGLPASGTAVWAVYPSNMNASLSAGNLVIDMPAVQKNALAGYFVAKAAVGDEAVLFKHPVSYYKLVVDGDGTDVTRLELTSAGSENLTASSLALSFDGSGIPSVAGVTGEAAEIDYEFTGAGTYYIPVVPGVAPAADDLTFQFYRTENAAPVKAGAYKHGAAIDNERAHIKNWGSLPARATNRYVSTSGTGSADGTTEATPWDIAQFKSFMEPSTASDRDLFDGLNIHFAAGTYTPSAKIAPNTPIRVNLIGEDKATTIFDGNNSMILFDIYKQSGETINFKNFTIQNAQNTSSNGGAFRIGNSTRVINISFEDCNFVNNSATASNKYGGVFNVTGATTMSLKNCTFIKNHAAGYGGVMYVENASYTTTVSFENCTFGDGTAANKNYSNSGSVFCSGNAQTHHFKDCVFDYNEGTGNWGSCIYLTVANGKVCLDNCLFKNNVSKNRGIVNANAQCLIYLNDVAFKDNTLTDATSYGLCVHANNQSLVSMNNVTAYNNHCSNASPSDNNFSFNVDGNFIIVNSTIVDNTPKHVVRQNTTDGKVSLCNNIVINRQGTAPFWFNASSTRVNNGHNLISASAVQGNLPENATDVFSITDAGLGGAYSELWNSTSKYAVYSWTNSLGGFTPATQTEVENTIKDYDYTIAGVEHVGTDFYNWLNSIGALGKDARGVARAGDWWPGAYQN